MVQNDKNTEQKILEAANEVFHSKGFDGARMQEIAQHAGINKGLLHYYFKTKDALFDAIFGIALNQIVSRITMILEQEASLEEKIDRIVDQYIDLLSKNPTLPRFVLNELNKNPDKFVSRHLDQHVRSAFEKFADSVAGEVARGAVRPIDARQLFTDLISMVIFPFIGRPMLQTLFGVNNSGYKQLLEARRTHIKEFMKASIRA
jgi:TetR/AcrR family transcriptional regulator